MLDQFLSEVRARGDSRGPEAALALLSYGIAQLSLKEVQEIRELQRLFTLAFSFRGFELASQVVKLRFPHAKMNFSLDNDDPPGPAVVRWQIDSRRESQFTFNAGIFETDLAMIVDRWAVLLPIFTAFAETRETSGVVYVNLGDEGHAPGLAFCDNRPEFHLIPDATFMAFDGYSETKQAYEQAAVRWEDRKLVAFWRGSSTGRKTGNLFSLPRVKLCQLGSSPPGSDFLDVGISTIVQIRDEEDLRDLEQSGLLRPYVPEREFVNFRFNIDIDGNTNSWPGFFKKLCTGSPVLKVESALGFRQWYYSRLEPWGNYVPVRSDMSDLLDIIRFLRSHDEIARRIGDAGARLAKSITVGSETPVALDTIDAAFAFECYRASAGR